MLTFNSFYYTIMLTLLRMVKLMKKIITFLLLCLLMITVSCVDADVNSNENKEVEIEYDFGGETFIFLQMGGFLYDIGDSVKGDMIMQRNADTKAKFNCDFRVDQGANDLVELNLRLASMTDVPSLADLHGYQAYPFFKQGSLYPVNAISTIDLRQTRWGTPFFLQYGKFDSENYYGIFAYDWPEVPQFAGVLYFNNKLLATYDGRNPYEMIEQGTWLWDEFYKMVENCTIQEDQTEYNGLGIQDDNYFNKMVLFSNGVSPVVENNKQPVFGYTSQETYKAMEYATKLRTGKSSTGKSLVSNGNWEIFSFPPTCVFYSGESWVGTEQGETRPSFEMDEYGFLPFPNGPDVEYGTTSAFVHMGRRLNFMFGISEADLEDFGIVLTYYLSPIEEGISEAWKPYLKDIVLHHNEDYPIFMKMMDEMKYDYTCQLADVNDKMNLAVAAAMSGKKTPSESMLGIEEIMNVAIAENIKSLMD